MKCPTCKGEGALGWPKMDCKQCKTSGDVKCVNCKLQLTDTVNVFGSKNNFRYFLYANDLAKIIVGLMEHYPTEMTPVICAPTEGHSIEQLMYAIADAVGLSHDKIMFESAEPAKKVSISNEYLLKLLPDLQFTPLTEGITQTVRAFPSHAIGVNN